MKRQVYKNSIYDPSQNLWGISKTNYNFLRRVALKEISANENLYNPEELELVQRCISNTNAPTLKIV